MAAPAGTVWGAVVNDYGRIGIYVSTSNTPTTTTANVQVWFWSKWSVSDVTNTLTFSDNKGSAKTVSNINVKTTCDSTNNGVWYDINQVLLYSYTTDSIARGTSKITRSFSADFYGINYGVGESNHMTASTSYEVPALEIFTISYNANGKTLTNSLPQNQTKYYGETVKLSNTVPTTKGFTCTGWRTSPSSGAVYNFGANYAANENVTLYASWVQWSRPVRYNSNTTDDVSNMPSNQSKFYGVDLVLNAQLPSRENYTFLGWSTVQDASEPSYSPGDTFTQEPTRVDDTAVELYAIWVINHIHPKISDIVITRCAWDSDSMQWIDTDDGNNIRVEFTWSIEDAGENSYYEAWASLDGEVINSCDNFLTGNSGRTSGIIDELSVEEAYAVYIRVVDDSGYGTTVQRNIPPLAFAIDVLAEGRGVSFGKPAKTPDILDSAWPIYEQGVSLTDKYGRVTGTSGESPDIVWTYTKWPDGRVDMWGTYSVTNVQCTTALGSWYRTAVISPGNFPFTINSPQLVANYESLGYGALLWPTTFTNTKVTPSYYLIRPTSGTIATGKIIFHVTGTWTEES